MNDLTFKCLVWPAENSTSSRAEQLSAGQPPISTSPALASKMTITYSQHYSSPPTDAEYTTQPIRAMANCVLYCSSSLTNTKEAHDCILSLSYLWHHEGPHEKQKDTVRKSPTYIANRAPLYLHPSLLSKVIELSTLVGILSSLWLLWLEYPTAGWEPWSRWSPRLQWEVAHWAAAEQWPVLITLMNVWSHS